MAQLPQFSYFKAPITNTVPTKTVTLVEVYQKIKEDFIAPTTALRQLTHGQDARAYKASNFDYVTFAGTFRRRSDQDLICPTQLLVIDFDHVKQPNQLKHQLLQDPYFETELLFASPSGQGIKWVIKNDQIAKNHRTAFQAVQHYLQQTYQLPVDGAGKDLSPACYLAHDPHVYLHPRYLKKEFKLDQWLIQPYRISHLPASQATLNEPNDYQRVGQLVLQLEAKRVDLTTTYEAWCNIGFALADTFGERGRHLYHRISQFHPHYDPPACDKQFDSCFHAKGSGITLGTLFYLAQQAGIELQTQQTKPHYISIPKPCRVNQILPNFS